MVAGGGGDVHGGRVSPIPSFPLNGEGECRVFMNTLSLMMVNAWLVDIVEGRLLVVKFGGQDGE